MTQYDPRHAFPTPPAPPAPAKNHRLLKRIGMIAAFFVTFLFGYSVGDQPDVASTSSYTGPAAAAPAYDSQPAYEAPTAEQVGGSVEIGNPIAVDNNGLVVTVKEVVSRRGITRGLSCIDVTYENRGSDYASRNPYDWSVRSPQGASDRPWIYGEKDALDSGELAPGGSDSGIVCFDVARNEIAAFEYKSSLFRDGPDAEWVVK